jgi:hypothetical protein
MGRSCSVASHGRYPHAISCTRRSTPSPPAGPSRCAAARSCLSSSLTTSPAGAGVVAAAVAREPMRRLCRAAVTAAAHSTARRRLSSLRRLLSALPCGRVGRAEWMQSAVRERDQPKRRRRRRPSSRGRSATGGARWHVERQCRLREELWWAVRWLARFILCKREYKYK